MMLTRKQAAKYLNLSYGTLANWATKKINLNYYKVGSRAMYLQSDLDEYIKKVEVTK